MRFFLLICTLFFFSPFAKAEQLIGGEITWICQNNQYVFTLKLYRDCNQNAINPTPIQLKVWSHPTIHTITVNFIQKNDLSPQCTQVSGSPSPLICGTGNNSGNGIGAMEEVIFRSQPISFSGTPPIQGWSITYEDASRNQNISNLVNPLSHGITISATIFQSQNGNCIYPSPQLPTSPILITCKGIDFSYNMNGYSDDADSISFELATPLDKITNSFNLPTDPPSIGYANGYTVSSPTPDNSFNPQNQALQLDQQTGEIHFRSVTTGYFVIKLWISSFKNKAKIATVQREFVVIVKDCGNSTNQPPVITSNLPANNVIDVIAGNTIDFDFTISDTDQLQDGTSQTIMVNASGEKFGSNFTSNNSGCGATPCATLNETLPSYFSNTKDFHFNWATSCEHLLAGNTVQEVKSYNFVLRAKDDYCQISMENFITFRVNIHNPHPNIPKISCIQGQSDGGYLVSFENTGFINLPFSIQDEANNNLISINSNTVTNAVIPPGNYNSFHLSYSQPCLPSGMSVSSNSLNTIHLTLQNPQNGTALLQWNAPTQNMSGYGNYYYIYQEYPIGNWNIIDSVPTTTTIYRDTISICKAFINYQIGIDYGACRMLSQVKGDTLQDLIAPSTPIITSVSIDTTSNNVQIQWSPSPESDTYGYIIYTTDEFGILHELDTVFGNLDTLFTYLTYTGDGALTYSVAAFDSCFTQTVPPTFQTSAKSNLHTSIFLTSHYDLCSKKVQLNWSKYIGWEDPISYTILQKSDTGWTVIGTTPSLSFTMNMEDYADSSYFVIQGTNSSGVTAFSNIAIINRQQSSLPAFHYTKVATVDHDKIVLRHYIEVLPFMSELVIQRKMGQQFAEIGRIPILGEESEYIDSIDIDVNKSSYTYRILYIDSCGNPTNPTNEVTTILAKINQVDEEQMKINLEWSPYSHFEGGIANYEIYRSVNNTYQWPAIHVATTHELNFEDDLDEHQIMNGKVCYKIVGTEGQNKYGFSEKSTSNEVCYVFEPLIYIPNAFTPNGINSVFKPVVNLIDFQNYTLTIFNRWNQIIFISNDVNTGWNGIMNNGKKAPFGVYGYQVSITDGNGKEIRKTGHVTTIWSEN